ncbi:hypothetical protein VOLCADRAFT_107690 [Volvox carteri f. nagariensis]|uniref:Uncharacterized protein n=1 Tax=Volvox carteri f. nagariensis TaxID=3068 RepID=D8UFN3_VOLCA|nr:uncharacterized protein VOLCADRAFT_107690 [Volvox carteri f. nagariensis]EFJ41532.1 hypothetical protein VOLCADRAFT_107690 [Volvox carteri f. nagariensis]|eukprot:XP_002957477.1 hypothetical protein VOLCADRAFT_107690 [Volvox carteri f. nagariensis]
MQWHICQSFTQWSSKPLRQTKLAVRAQAVSETTPAFKLPKVQLPKDPEGIKSFIAKSHQMHGQGRSMWFCLSGAGKRATTGTYLAHADTLDWNAASSGSIDSYNIYS